MIWNLSLSIICLIYSFNYIALAASAVVGIDLGTEYIKATIVKPGIPLDIVLTKDSRRKELSAIAFKPEKNLRSGQFPERLYGSDAITLASRFPGDVYPNLKTLLGLGTENLIVKEYALRHPKLKLTTENETGTANFKSDAFLPEEQPWSVEEILAMELQNVIKNAQALAGKGSSIKDVVMTIPVFYTVEEKRAVRLAADLAGLNILELISDGLAVGINYATARTFSSINEGGKAESHLIFDMGAGSTKASVLRFQGKTVKDTRKLNKTIQEIKVLGSGWDRTLGGDFFNTLIIDDIVAQFVASPAAKKISVNADTIKSDGKVSAKLHKEAERIRQILSANANTQTFFEGLYEDIDFKYKITRSEFEKLTEPHAPRISRAIQRSLDAAGLKTEDLDSIILHGGTSRTPFVQRELERFIRNVNKLKTNVNSDESAVFGAGFRGATLSPSFKVKVIRISDGISYASGVKWTNVYNKKQHQVLWQATSSFGEEKRYTFKNQEEPFVLSFYQRVPSLEGSSLGTTDQEMLVVTSQNLTNSVTFLKEKYGCTQAEITVRLSARLLADSGEVDITRLVVGCEALEDKESMVDSVKGLFGFGKKDQAPLLDGETSESVTSMSKTVESTSTTKTESASASTNDPSQEKPSKARKVTRTVPLSYTIEIKGRSQLSPSEISRRKERLAAFSSSDNLRRLREEALNQLESFTYKVRDLLHDADFITASTEQERTNIESKSRDTSDWIYSGGTEASREEFKKRHQELKNMISPIEFRKLETASRPAKILALQNSLKETKQLILSINEQIANDTKKYTKVAASNSVSQASTTTEPSSVEKTVNSGEQESTVTNSVSTEQPSDEPSVYSDTDLSTSQKLYDEYTAWLEEKLASQEKLEKNDNPVLLTKDLEERIKTLQDSNIQLYVKNMRRSAQNWNSKKKKTKKSSDTKNKADKTVEESSSNISDIPSATFTVAPDGRGPSEEEMLEYLKKFDFKPNEAEKTEKTEKADEENQNKEDTVPKHNEL